MAKKFHIIGLNSFGISLFKYLKKKKLKVSISDLKNKKDLKKFFKSEAYKYCKFANHPEDLISSADIVIYTPGVVKNDQLYIRAVKNKKIVSEIDIFKMYSKWPREKILSITGSKGKSTCCNYIKKKLEKKRIFKKIFIAGRKDLPLTSLPKYKRGYFLIAELDYQLLSIKKLYDSKYNIITNIDNKENYLFSLRNYMNIKFNLINLKKVSFLITTKKIKLKTNFPKRKILIKTIGNIKDSNATSKNLSDRFINLISKPFINFL